MGINMGKLVEIEERGRILIPKEIRKYLGLKAGEKLVFIKSQNELVIRRKYDSKTQNKSIRRKKISMFGADKKLSKWNESDERARFR